MLPGAVSGQVVLEADEAAAVRARIAALNGVIAAEAELRDFGLVDAFAVTTTWATSGIVVPDTDVPYSVDDATGGVFSVDGLNFTPAGNALFANEFISAINDRFDAELPLISPLCYARESASDG